MKQKRYKNKISEIKKNEKKKKNIEINKIYYIQRG